MVYLGVCLLGPSVARQEKVIYMLNWRTALDTMKTAAGRFEGSPCILSHYGVHRDMKAVLKANLQAFEEMEGRILEIMPEEFYLEDMVKGLVGYMGILVKSLPKARLMERVVRSLLEYMAETGRLEIGIKDGMIVYMYGGSPHISGSSHMSGGSCTSGSSRTH